MNLHTPQQTGFLANFKNRYMKTRPVVNISACTGCASCKMACPNKAIELFACIPLAELPPKTGEPRQRPEINRNICTRCYRCKEQCPHKAVKTLRPWLMRALKL
ncbi:MAG: 4Fe-4S binding protein [Defluviitaleaceae bacterium]|nr:4Fe-4S binding protein [Defluviitaleaceae bacterium]